MNLLKDKRFKSRLFVFGLSCIFVISLFKLFKTRTHDAKLFLDDVVDEEPTRDVVIRLSSELNNSHSHFKRNEKHGNTNLDGVSTKIKNFGASIEARIEWNARSSSATPFDFALKVQHLNRCDLLFATPPFDQFSTSSLYQQKIEEFNEFVDRQFVNGVYDEGYSALVPEKMKALHYMAQAGFVRTICETGFNYGHSSFNFLTANPHAIVHSFDLGNHDYAKVMAAKMKEMFPGRIEVHFGDSLNTVPLFIKNNPDFKCDLMFIDGGHTYAVAKSDLQNFISIANKKNNIIIFDDYPTNWGTEFGRAWEELVASKVVSEKFRCMRVINFERGILAGVVL